MKTLYLQIKPHGAWRDVVEFATNQLHQVQGATVHLAHALRVGADHDDSPCIGVEFRITASKSRSPKVIAYLGEGKLQWRKT